MRGTTFLLMLGAVTLVTAPMGLGQSLVGNALLNGDFELALPGGQALCDHVGDHEIAVPPDPAPFPVAILDTCTPGAMKALAWSSPDSTTFGDADGDGDREALIPVDGSHHNLWQVGVSSQQAFSGDFQALEFDLEAGELDGVVIISLSDSPLESQNPWLGIFITCQLRFSTSLLQASMDASGHVSVPPTEAAFNSRYTTCDAMDAAWDGADDDQRREMLGRLRVVQTSFWGFESGAEDPACSCAAQIDNVALRDPSSVAEQAASGNVNPNPGL